MPYTKEKLREYWTKNKTLLNQKRRQKRRLAKLGLAMAKVSPNQVSHLAVSQKIANPVPVSHGKPILEMANPILVKLIQAWQTSINYNCAVSCSQNKYCSNCWFWEAEQLIAYKKEVSV